MIRNKQDLRNSIRQRRYCMNGSRLFKGQAENGKYCENNDI